MELLNQNVKLVPNADDTEIRLINTVNGQELARFSSYEPIKVWVNKGVFMTFEEYLEYQRKQLYKLDSELVEQENG